MDGKKFIDWVKKIMKNTLSAVKMGTRVTDLFRVVLSQDWRWRRRKSLPDIKVLSHSKFFDIRHR